LSKVSAAWKKRFGFGTSVAWPTGVGAKGNEGVASYVQRINGAIGYNEYAYVLENHMNYARMINRAGKAVTPSAQSFQAAAANADWSQAEGFYVVLTNQAGAGSWPISGATFVLIHKHPKNPWAAQATLKFFDWAFANGSKLAASLDYVPMPPSVVKVIQEAWHRQIAGKDDQPLWPPL
jgi:phosphate transport system substrate-binding protein